MVVVYFGCPLVVFVILCLIGDLVLFNSVVFTFISVCTSIVTGFCLFDVLICWLRQLVFCFCFLVYLLLVACCVVLFVCCLCYWTVIWWYCL